MPVYHGIIYPSLTVLIFLNIFKPYQIQEHFGKFIIIYRLGIVRFFVKLINFFSCALSSQCHKRNHMTI